MGFNIRKYLPSSSFIRGFGSILNISGSYYNSGHYWARRKDL